MGQFTGHMFYTWRCRLTHMKVLCSIPLVQTGVRNKRRIFPQVLQLINTGPSFECWQGDSDTMLCTNHCAILLPALTHPPRAAWGLAPQELCALTVKGVQRSGVHHTWG